LRLRFRSGRSFVGRVKRVALAAIAIGGCLWLCAAAGAAGDANESQCEPSKEASPGFHAYLPGCSALELVTPPYIAGGIVGAPVKSQLPPMSANGEHVVGLVFAGFAGTENLEQNSFQYGAVYEFSRTPSGWTTEALDPPASVYPRRSFLFASGEDLTRSLWYAQNAVEQGHELPPVPPNGILAENNNVLIVREAAGDGKGRFSEVGPVSAPGHEPAENAPPEVRGASASLSHVLLDVPAVSKQLWPGDGTLENAHSLYEYVGTGESEPALVGVRNEGSVAEAAAREGKAHVNEAAELISRCGTVAGGREVGGVLNNAISASGETVFFTALACADGPKVNELYARVDGERTVHISEPSTGAEGDCATCNERELQPAIYAGAAEDGSAVFFYSEQELLPNAKANGNNLYAYNFDAEHPHERLTLISPDVQNAVAISASGALVYFESQAVLTGAANGNGETAAVGSQNLYVAETADPQALKFVAREAGGARVTPDGRFVAFESNRHFAGTGDSSTVSQIFEYDRESGVITRVSIAQRASGECELTKQVEERMSCDGNTDNGEDAPVLAEASTEQAGNAYAPTTPTSSLTIDENGDVLFQSLAALTEQAYPGGRNVYEYQDGEVFLISPGDEAVAFKREPGESRMLGISLSGSSVFFSSPEQLLPQDTDTALNWYDAQEKGGFGAPATVPGCSGEACQGATSVAPSLPGAPKTALTPGGGNLAPSPPPSAPAVKPKSSKCKKGYVKKKNKCVKKPKAKNSSNDKARR
jgi:hypothetical protein